MAAPTARNSSSRRTQGHAARIPQQVELLGLLCIPDLLQGQADKDVRGRAAPVARAPARRRQRVRGHGRLLGRRGAARAPEAAEEAEHGAAQSGAGTGTVGGCGGVRVGAVAEAWALATALR
jgi:hypothetical protein